MKKTVIAIFLLLLCGFCAYKSREYSQIESNALSELLKEQGSKAKGATLTNEFRNAES